MVVLFCSWYNLECYAFAPFLPGSNILICHMTGVLNEVSKLLANHAEFKFF